MSEVPDNLVRTGFWVNHSRSFVLGSTITTDTRSGIVVVALLAILISLGTAHLWNLLIFGYYQHRGRNGRKDGLFLQQQVFLRTLPSPEAFFVDFFRLSWTWRKFTTQSLLQCLVPCSFSLIFLVTSVLAGIYSSLVVTTTDLEVLVNSGSCGYPPGFLHGDRFPLDWLEATQARAVSGQTYSQNCYSNESVPAICKIFVTPRISYSKEKTNCPFDVSLCNGEADVAIALDTGHLDVNDILGINTSPQNRISVRYKTTCAPLKVENMITMAELNGVVDVRPALPGEQSFNFHYGTRPLLGNNYTFGLSTYVSNVTYGYGIATGIQYADKRVTGGYVDFDFLPGLQRPDADTMLYFIWNNQVKNRAPVNDPVFSAHNAWHPPPHVTPHTAYAPDYPGGVVGCTEQIQFCLPGYNQRQTECTPLRGLPSHKSNFLPNANEIQQAILRLFTLSRITISDSEYTPTPVLKALATVDELGLQAASLPQNQWILEFEGWFGFFLSELQVWLTQFATGSTFQGKVGNTGTVAPKGQGENYLCRSQKVMKPGGFANLNVFGLSFVVAISGILILADTLLLKCLIFLKGFRNIFGYRIDGWIDDGVLHLQRQVFEANDGRPWIRLDKDIPLPKM